MQSMTFFVKLLLALALLVPAVGHAGAGYPYRVTVLLPFTPEQGSGVATMINNQGLICGTQTPGTKGFCYDRGAITELQPLPGNTVTAAFGVNDFGQVVGVSYGIDGRYHAVVFVNGVAQRLAVADNLYSSAIAINNLGQIVGGLSNVLGESLAYVSWFGAVRELGTLGGPRRIDTANSINDRGQIVGLAIVNVKRSSRPLRRNRG